MLEQVNHNLIDQPLDWCVPKPGVKKPVTQDHHRQTNVLKGSAIKVQRLRDKKGKSKVIKVRVCLGVRKGGKRKDEKKDPLVVNNL